MVQQSYEFAGTPQMKLDEWAAMFRSTCGGDHRIVEPNAFAGWIRRPSVYGVTAAAIKIQCGFAVIDQGDAPYRFERTRRDVHEPEGAAFGLRREHFMVEIIAGWKPDGDDGASHRRWARDLRRRLARFALPGGYANLLGPDDREQVADAYGGNAARLRVLKRRFDPDGVFASAIPLPEG
jgi:hypothetical protein